MGIIGNDWDMLIADEFKKEYFRELCSFLRKEYAEKAIYPEKQNVFNALKLTAYSDVKIVILGQDPYHGKGQAHGLAFSVPKGVTIPPSLQNIFKEIHNETGRSIPNSGDLTSWAKKGILLLNTTLTVREGTPNSHKGKGWEIFTDKIISLINEKENPVCFLLWGRNAKNKIALIDDRKHLVLTAPHPSPLSANSGFFGCGHFLKANRFIKRNYTGKK
ncbi:MAG: uracil-DNA glycosylase [Clostridiales Family XIII bacterium]|jgi:uracil-DNA glycosylase|nr:uracil-DNA glycosylase [Clostridiales Family XIII bacterium]